MASQVSDTIHDLTFGLWCILPGYTSQQNCLFFLESHWLLLLDCLCFDAYTCFHFEVSERKPALLVKEHSLDQDVMEDLFITI